MKRIILLFLLILMQFGLYAQELTVSDVQNSGCLSETRANARAGEYGEKRTIILTKEGDALHVQLLNYVANCGTSGFDVTPSMSGGSDGTPCSVAVSVEPVIFADADCDCPYNVSFTVHGLEANSFLFSCWWCEGMVTLTDGEPLVLEDVWEDVSIEDLGYKIHEVMHSAQLTGGKSWEGELNIPSEVNYEGQKYVVTNIGYNAFVDNTALTSVTIPNTVLSIGSGAFARCTGLTSIVIPEGVKSLGHNVFSGCTNLASITIPNSVIQIGGSVFNGTAWYDNQPDGVIYAGRMAYTYKGTMPEGTQIDIKEGTIAIANNAFCRCDNLTSVTIPGSVSTIGYDAFWRCNNLKTVIISEGVKRIEHAAFSNCTSLESIVIPESVTHIGEYAFMECTALTSATINGAITRMGRWAFGGCTALYSLSISQNVKDIGNETFSNCTSLYRVKIPGSVTRLGDGLFYRCSNLYSVQIFEGVEAIGYSAFGECNNMSYVILPNSLTKIDDYAFYNCSKLNEVICFADNVPTTGGNVFYNSPIASATLNVPSASVDLYKAVSPWKDFARITPPHVNGWNVSIDGFNYFLYPESHTAELNNKNSRSGELDIPTEVSYKGHTYSVNGMIVNAFSGCTQLTKVRIPKTIDHVVHHVLSEDPNIGGAFSSYYMNPFTGCTALESIEVDEENPIFSSDGGVLFNKDKTRLYGYPAGARQTSYTVPESITWVGDDAFANNQYLTTLTIPNSVTRLGSGVCSGCANLKSVRLPENITLIGAYSFQYCPKLKFLDIPENVQSFGEYVFRSTPFEAIVFRGTFPQGLRNDTFYSMDDSTILYVQRSEINKFKAVFSGQVLPLDSYTPPVAYFPEGTKWTEIRLDTLKYNSWYSKVGEDWVPNFETIEYRVQGEYTDMGEVYKKVYSNGPEWTDSLAFLLLESRQNVEMTVIADGYALWPGVAYQFNWSVGKGIYYRDILESNSTGEYPIYLFFGVINEIKEGEFGGVRPLKYVDLDGKAPDNTYEYWDWGFTDARGGRIIQGIGITEWNDGECLFGPPDPYYAGYGWRGDYKSRHYRSMLVHFERNNEVLYDVWPKKEIPSGITIKDVQSANQGILFDLQGRRVANPRKGIYIKDGRKVLVK